MRHFYKFISILLAAIIVAVFFMVPVAADEEYGYFLYTVNGNAVTITSYLGSEDEVVVPSEIDGKPVTTISTAFGGKTVKSVVLPDSVTTIESYAFNACTLEKITLSKNLTSIGTYSFSACPNLKHVEIPNGFTTIPSYAFKNCGALESVVIPASVTSIKVSSFEGTTATIYGVSGSYAQTYAAANSKTFVALPAFSGKQLAIGSDLSMIFYAKCPYPSLPTVEFTIGERSETVAGIYSDGEYVFRFNRITPQQMGETITATLSVDGFADVVQTTTVREYLLEVAEKYPSDEPLLTLIADTLGYGAAAQKYVDPSLSAESLVNYGTGLVPSTFSSAPASILDKTTVNATDGFDFKTVGLRFENVNKLFAVFTAGEGYRVFVNSTDVTDRVIEKGGEYYIYTDGIFASNFGESYTFYLYSGETLVQTLRYSVNSMVAAKYNSSDEVTAALARATYLYGVSAINYLESRGS